MTVKLEKIVASSDHRMLRYMAGVRWQDGLSSEVARRPYGIENIRWQIRKNRLRWYGHVVIAGEDSFLKNGFQFSPYIFVQAQQ